MYRWTWRISRGSGESCGGSTTLFSYYMNRVSDRDANKVESTSSDIKAKEVLYNY